MRKYVMFPVLGLLGVLSSAWAGGLLNVRAAPPRPERAAPPRHGANVHAHTATVHAHTPSFSVAGHAASATVRPRAPHNFAAPHAAALAAHPFARAAHPFAPATVNRTTVRHNTFRVAPAAHFGAARATVVGHPRSATYNRIATVNRGINLARPSGIYRPGYAHYHNLHGGWHRGYWSGWYSRPWWHAAGGAAAGLGVGWLSPWGGSAYYNPYYAAPVAPATAVFNYSQLIPVPEPVALNETGDEAVEENALTTQPTDADSSAAAQAFDDARQAFMNKDYDAAQSLIDRAVTLQPSDATLHEFRALVLFARQQYPSAAAIIHDVLAVGPGWDWATLRGLYPDTETYTVQMRALEQYCKAHPQDAAAWFLLAYHYLVIDARGDAGVVLKTVVALQPKDEIAARLLQTLQTPTPTDRPLPGSQ